MPYKDLEKEKAYRLAHREESNARRRAHHVAHREEDNKKCRTYQATHKDEIKAYLDAHRGERNAYSKQYYKEHKQEFLDRQAISRQKMKQTVFTHYAGGEPKCAHCGENDLIVLCLDHINNDGNIHRKVIGLRGGYDFYRRLKRDGFPEGYQVLCYNCNMRKEFERTRRNQ